MLPEDKPANKCFDCYHSQIIYEQTLGKRIDRVKVEQERTGQYLEELEKSMVDDRLAEWRAEEAKWKEIVEHLEWDGGDINTPYETIKHQGM